VVDHFHQEFNVIREQRFDIIKCENFVFENNILNEGMMNAIKTKKLKKMTYILV